MKDYKHLNKPLNFIIALLNFNYLIEYFPTNSRYNSKNYSRLAHDDAADIASLELSLATATGKHLCLEHEILSVEFLGDFFGLVGALGHPKFRGRYTGAFQQRVSLVFVDIQVPQLTWR